MMASRSTCLLLLLFSAAAFAQEEELSVRATRMQQRREELRIGADSLSSCAVRSTLSCGARVTSSLTTGSCLDSATNSRGERYAIQATRGDVLTIEQSSTAFSVFLVVTGPSFFLDFGNTLSFISTGGRSTQRLDFYAPATGTYYIEAESLYGPGDSQPSTGTYTLNVTCAATAPTCVNANTLYLNNSRFQVTLFARDQRSGNTASGLAIPANDLFGYFSLPGLTNNPNNAEVFLKILDGRPVNGRFWVFYNGLTDLQFTLTVRDTQTGQTRTYEKGPGSSCGGFDTAAF